jgi:hypothetical protein
LLLLLLLLPSRYWQQPCQQLRRLLAGCWLLCLALPATACGGAQRLSAVLQQTQMLPWPSPGPVMLSQPQMGCV